jgi:thiol-disulfide isomerase/thioredoxin
MSSRTTVGLLLLVTLCALPAWAQVPSDSLFKGFQPVGDFFLEIDGTQSRRGEVYRSERAAALLLFAPELSSPVLIVPRTGSVQTVNIMKVAKQGDGSIDLLADAVLAHQGRFDIRDDGVVFSLGAKQVAVRERPPLLGAQDLAGMEDYDPSYGRLAAQYEPSGSAMAALAKQSDEVVVKVYFGTWCPFCRRYVPRMMKVAGEMEGSRVKVDFYGLPRQLSEDPVTKKYKITGVPTGIVMVNGREVGRIDGDEWTTPELALRKLLR